MARRISKSVPVYYRIAYTSARLVFRPRGEAFARRACAADREPERQAAGGGPPERSGSKLIIVRLVEQLSNFFGTARFFQEPTERLIA